MSLFEGVATALITPFTDNSINIATLKKLIDFQIAGGVKGLVILGTTGENPTVNDDERDIIVKTTIAEVAGRIPVIVGTGSNDTTKAVEYTKRAKEQGADGVLVVTPYYNKTNSEGLYQHYASINEVGIPIIMYTVPSRTGMNPDYATIEKISKLDNVVALKEATGNMEFVSKLARLINDKFDLYSGEDGLTLPYMSVGAKGVICTTSNIAPKQMQAICDKFFAGDIAGARKAQLELLDLISAVFIETNPIATKKAVELLGYDVGKLRQPLWEISEKSLEVLKKEMKRVGLL